MEVTLEANPGTVDADHFQGYRQAGINRLSLGFQSLHDQQLQKLGRIHSSVQALQAFTIARESGFDNINIDLMYALPKQTMQGAAVDIEQAIELDPTHISYYQLTIEPNTRFYQHPPSLPTNDVSWELYQQGVSVLAHHGFQQYEVSAYCKTDYHCIHNCNYWRFGDYVGIGAGAHQKLSCTKRGTIARSEKFRHPQKYIRQTLNKIPNSTTQLLDSEDIQFEFLLNALRLRRGFNRQQYEMHTGLRFELLLPRLTPLQDEGLIVLEDDWVQCSERGFHFLDEVLQRLLPEYRESTYSCLTS